MTTQEKIREGIAEEIYDIINEYRYGCKQVGKGHRFAQANPNIQKQLLGWASQILKYEDSKGVVQKADELPIITKKGWYYLVEPLIEMK